MGCGKATTKQWQQSAMFSDASAEAAEIIATPQAFQNIECAPLGALIYGLAREGHLKGIPKKAAPRRGTTMVHWDLSGALRRPTGMGLTIAKIPGAFLARLHPSSCPGQPKGPRADLRTPNGGERLDAWGHNRRCQSEANNSFPPRSLAPRSGLVMQKRRHAHRRRPWKAKTPRSSGDECDPPKPVLNMTSGLSFPQTDLRRAPPHTPECRPTPCCVESDAP